MFPVFYEYTEGKAGVASQEMEMGEGGDSFLPVDKLFSVLYEHTQGKAGVASHFLVCVGALHHQQRSEDGNKLSDGEPHRLNCLMCGWEGGWMNEWMWVNGWRWIDGWVSGWIDMGGWVAG